MQFIYFKAFIVKLSFIHFFAMWPKPIKQLPNNPM